jgi:hypothetical protein
MIDLIAGQSGWQSIFSGMLYGNTIGDFGGIPKFDAFRCA